MGERPRDLFMATLMATLTDDDRYAYQTPEKKKLKPEKKTIHSDMVPYWVLKPGKKKGQRRRRRDKHKRLPCVPS
jgi:hypothetical protein